MERPALAGQEIVVGGLLDEGVAEGEAGGLAVAVLDEQVAVDGSPEALGQLVLGQVDDLGEQVVVDPPAGDRGHAEHALRAVGRGRDPGGQRRLDRRRQAGDGRGSAGHQQLLDEEGVAVGPVLEPAEARPLRLLAEDRGDHPGGVVAAEPLEVDPLEPAGPAELREPRQEGMPAVQLVGPIREADHDAIGGEARDEVGQREPGRRVRPVEVLDDEQHRAGRRQVLEDPEQGVEEVRLGADAVDRDVVRRPAQGAGLRGRGCGRRQDRADRRDEGGEGAQGARPEGREQLPVVRRRSPPGSPPRSGRTAGPTPPIATQPPRRTRKPRSAARRAISRVSRVLPTPASPERRRWVGIVGDAVEDELGQPDLVGPADEDGTDASPRHSPDDRRGGRGPDMDGCHPGARAQPRTGRTRRWSSRVRDARRWRAGPTWKRGALAGR